MHRVAAVTTLAALAVVVSTAAPAAADTTTFRDPRGDARARYDLTTVTVANGNDRLTVTAHLGNLRGGGTQILGLSLDPTRGGTTYSLFTVRRPSGKTTASLTGYGSRSAIAVQCKIARTWKPAKDTVVVSFPRDCVGEQGALRVSAYIGAGDGSSGDPADWTKTVRVGQG
jgi:hypothetical protein